MCDSNRVSDSRWSGNTMALFGSCFGPVAHTWGLISMIDMAFHVIDQLWKRFKSTCGVYLTGVPHRIYIIPTRPPHGTTIPCSIQIVWISSLIMHAVFLILKYHWNDGLSISAATFTSKCITSFLQICCECLDAIFLMNSAVQIQRKRWSNWGAVRQFGRNSILSSYDLVLFLVACTRL